MKQNELCKKIGIDNYNEILSSVSDYFESPVDEIFDNVELLTFNSDEEYDGIVDMYAEGVNTLVANMEVSGSNYSTLLGGLELSGNVFDKTVNFCARHYIILFPEDDFTKPEAKYLLVSQLLQYLKSSGNKFSISSTNITVLNGISETIYSIVLNGSTFTLEYVGTRGLGLESTFNAIQVEDLAFDYLDIGDKCATDKLYMDFLKDLYYDEDFNKELIKAQLSGKKGELIKHFDSRTYKGAYETLELFWDKFFGDYNYAKTIKESKLALTELSHAYETYLSPLYEMYSKGGRKNAGNSRSRNSKECLKS